MPCTSNGLIMTPFEIDKVLYLAFCQSIDKGDEVYTVSRLLIENIKHMTLENQLLIRESIKDSVNSGRQYYIERQCWRDVLSYLPVDNEGEPIEKRA